jgi:CDP-diacylglycerol--glycerol-3-phosphate 3-phosphatidyltransferase
MNNLLKILEVKLDDALTAYILDRFSLFKFISPNLITISGLLMNFLILYYIISGDFYAASIFLILRYLADCLDGGVARKYNKKSKIGGALDTWSDTILIYISIYGIFYIYKLPFGSEIAAFACCGNMYIMSLTNSLVDHAGMKSGKNMFSIVYAFFVNNSFILFIMKIIAISFILI